MWEEGLLPSHYTLTSPAVVGFPRLAYSCLTCICLEREEEMRTVEHKCPEARPE
jgi:hypothetical protein